MKTLNKKKPQTSPESDKSSAWFVSESEESFSIGLGGKSSLEIAGGIYLSTGFAIWKFSMFIINVYFIINKINIYSNCYL